MSHYWPYFDLRPDGVLVYSDTKIPLALADGSSPVFVDAVEAEAWLAEQDIRGSVR